jgi:hypothetical protein
MKNMRVSGGFLRNFYVENLFLEFRLVGFFYFKCVKSKSYVHWCVCFQSKFKTALNGLAKNSNLRVIRNLLQIPVKNNLFVDKTSKDFPKNKNRKLAIFKLERTEKSKLMFIII